MNTLLTLNNNMIDARMQLVQTLDKAIGYHFPKSGDRDEWVLEGVAVSNASYLTELHDVQERFVNVPVLK
jgi:hypothetical protein